MMKKSIPGLLCAFFIASCALAVAAAEPNELNGQLRHVLASEGFTGKVESTLTQRPGRPLDPVKANLGRLLFFDKFVGLHGDNSCACCHSLLNGSGDS